MTNRSPVETLLNANAVTFKPDQPEAGTKVAITYEGLLARKPGRKVHVHLGYGRDSWTGIRDIAMTPGSESACECTITLNGSGPLNVCFYDSDGTWDNNLGMNWQLKY